MTYRDHAYMFVLFDYSLLTFFLCLIFTSSDIYVLMLSVVLMYDVCVFVCICMGKYHVFMQKLIDLEKQQSKRIGSYVCKLLSFFSFLLFCIMICKMIYFVY